MTQLPGTAWLAAAGFQHNLYHELAIDPARADPTVMHYGDLVYREGTARWRSGTGPGLKTVHRRILINKGSRGHFAGHPAELGSLSLRRVPPIRPDQRKTPENIDQTAGLPLSCPRFPHGPVDPS